MKTSLLPSPRVVILAASLALAPCICVAASAAELLEKGIYTEETKGDVDGAIAIYKQLVAEARANHALGAQAQYRLALCLEKKGRTSEATAAFEKLIGDFPSEKELVAQAREHLPADITLGPVTWVDGERLKYVLTVADGTEIGAMETSADLVQADGPKVWRVGRNMSGGGQSVSRVDVEPESFRPLASYWKHTMLGEVSAVYGKDGIELKKAGSAEVTKLPLEKTVFDNEECFHLLRRLPLKEGYKATINVASTLGGGIIPLGFEVVKKETLTVPAGKFECFKLQLSVGQALWFADNAQRPLVKFEGGGAVGELAAITQRKAGVPIAFRDDDLGITFTAPADWMEIGRAHV